MNTCGTCKFRGEPIIENPFDEKSTGIEGKFFLCDLIKHHGRESGGYISLATHIEDFQKSGVGVFDGSGYHAALCVADDFGCNKWEAK